ncbi:MAG: CCA tRNA nucleotidyltransferase [Pseudomonadota bacterium]
MRIDADWLKAEPLQTLLLLLEKNGEEARVNGGAVRNALMGMPVADVDVSSTLVPRDVMLRLKEAGHRAIPTGVEHGTVTAVIDGGSFEVTTLRQDIETDGRHARVLYGKDWEADARRRDLTINALYVDRHGEVFDPLDAMPDIERSVVRFIDDAETRIREDYLRILRFFRFFAWYGKFRPDADGLKACARLKDGLDTLSAERVWQELWKTLSAPDPSRAILWMRQTNVLSRILPESEKWGIENLSKLVESDANAGREPDAMLRLMSIIPPQNERVESLASRLRIPNKQRDRLRDWAEAVLPDAKLSKTEFARLLYRGKPNAVADRLKLAIATTPEPSLKKSYIEKLDMALSWQRPEIPVRGQDLLDHGMEPGPGIAQELAKLEEAWIESDFSLSREELLKLHEGRS